MWEYGHSDELYHYGVTGMRWGVRRGNTSGVYAKANKKMAKLTSKMVKTEQRRVKKSRYLTEIGRGQYVSSQRKADKAKYRTQQWYNKVSKTLGKKSADEMLTANTTEIGRQYVQTLIK